MNAIEDCAGQLDAVAGFFDELGGAHGPHAGGCRRQADEDEEAAGHAATNVEAHEQETYRRMRAQPAWKAISATCAAPSPTACTRCWCKVVEKPLLEVVMAKAEQNQSKAAEWLGLNRNTLRKKLVEHKLLK